MLATQTAGELRSRSNRPPTNADRPFHCRLPTEDHIFRNRKDYENYTPNKSAK
jgi:hypothetical protein